MSQQKQRQWLQQEVVHWQQERIIDDSQAERILARYPVADNSQTARTVLSVIGAIIFGLGIILFFAYNWQDMHRYLKLFLVLVLFASTHVGALFFDRDPQRRAAAEALAILGTVLFGAAIWLVSQIYHIDEHMPNAFWMWGVGALLMAWVRRSELQLLAALILLTVWSAMEIVGYNISLHHSPFWLLFGVVPLSVFLRSRRLLFCAISLFFFLWMVSLHRRLDDVLVYVVFAFAVLLVHIGFLLPRLSTLFPALAQWQPQAAFRVPGMLVYLVYVYLLTFLHFEHAHLYRWVEGDSLQQAMYIAALLVSLSACFSSWLPLPRAHSLALLPSVHSALMLLSTIVVFAAGPRWWAVSYDIVSAIANIVLLGHSFVLIANGNQNQRGIDVVLACVLLSALVFARFTDLFDSLLARSLAFLLLGAALFVIGSFYLKQKKQQTDLGAATGAQS